MLTPFEYIDFLPKTILLLKLENLYCHIDRDNGVELRGCEMGLIRINLTNPTQEVGMAASPAIWSRPIPLGWYFGDQWRRYEGPNWVQDKCDKWIAQDRLLKNFANELPMVRLIIT